MPRFLQVLREFFSRDAVIPLAEPLLNGGLSTAAHELYYAELIDREFTSKYREYPWPPGWNG